MDGLLTSGRIVVSITVFVAGSIVLVTVVHPPPWYLDRFTAISFAAKPLSFSWDSVSPKTFDSHTAPSSVRYLVCRATVRTGSGAGLVVSVIVPSALKFHDWTTSLLILSSV